jgi:HD-GYP domain-containing protein (c-di-GMP phosphodiesterase class II)
MTKNRMAAMTAISQLFSPADHFIIEARILSVAVVVESMASRRPYRPAMGIEIALEVIEKNKGILYDNNVAEACLRFFREKGYQLS